MKAHAHPGLPELGERLRRKSHKLTGPRQSILNVLRQHARPLSNKQIHAALARGECDLATVYRSMRLLEQIGIVKKFDLGDGRAEPNHPELNAGSHLTLWRALTSRTRDRWATSVS